ncbi:unnamed protein product [Staurois parvus]|uniref:Uncharacterized protein n=1 Tax=Staurois parvus TaxID=386267 RepID=A0ABN9EV16_9NEOB|nr:unnamed protein product [Staurois parvus]
MMLASQCALWQIVTSLAHVFFSTVGLCGGFLQIAWLHIGASSNCNSTHR